jgi:hypothetical protein
VWRIVKYEHHNGYLNRYKLNEGDLIKFGRVRFLIKKLVIDADDVENSAADEDIEEDESKKKQQIN